MSTKRPQKVVEFYTPEALRCRNKCNAGWLPHPFVEVNRSGIWTALSVCRGCGSRNYWDFNPNLLFEQQEVFIKESYERY